MLIEKTGKYEIFKVWLDDLLNDIETIIFWLSLWKKVESGKNNLTHFLLIRYLIYSYKKNSSIC